jgi:phosphatidylglycerophosphatase A
MFKNRTLNIYNFFNKEERKMSIKSQRINTDILREKTIEMLNERGITVDNVAEVVVEMQKKYMPDITHELAAHNVVRVLQKREVCHAILTGLALDQLAEMNCLPYPLQQVIEADEPLYGIDEVIALAIATIYGSVGSTTFGYLDQAKIGIIKELDTKDGAVHTFADDIAAAIAAAASGRIAHRNRDEEDNTIKGS